MKKFYFLLVLLSFLSVKTSAQYYVEFAPQITNDIGNLGQKANFAIEVGKQWDVFSLGLDLGKTNLGKISGRDTATYIEVRPNLNIFQVGKFTNTFTAGIGYIFNAREPMMTELTYGIEYSASDRIHVNANFGQYFYSGMYSASNVTFFGLSVMYYFKTSKTSAMIVKKN